LSQGRLPQKGSRIKGRNDAGGGKTCTPGLQRKGKEVGANSGNRIPLACFPSKEEKRLDSDRLAESKTCTEKVWGWEESFHSKLEAAQEGDLIH